MGFISLLMMMVLIVTAFVTGAALYIIAAVGLMGFAKKRGIENAWLAWIPFCNLCLIGRMFPAGVTIGASRLYSLDALLPAAAVAAVLIRLVPFIDFVGTLLSLMLYVFLVYLCNLLFKEYRPGNSLLYAVFFPIGFFLLRTAPRVNVV